MFQMFFSLRFQSQLRRTRPKLLLALEKSIVETIENFGGKVRVEHKLISASFDDASICFWLDMLCILETIKNALEKASSELYGHICVLGEDISEDDIPLLARGLPSDIWGTGIWCSPPLRSILEPYLVFDEPLPGGSNNIHIKGYSQLKDIRELPASLTENQKPVKLPGNDPPPDNSERIRQYLSQGTLRNTVIVGSEFIGKREGLYSFCASSMGDFPPLVIRFRKGVNAITSIVDVLSPGVRKTLTESQEKLPAKGRLEELENLGETLFRERLRAEVSDFLVKQGERFFTLLLDMYCFAADKAGVKPVLILEDLQTADSLARLIITGLYASFPQKERLFIYGTCTGMEVLGSWEEIFPRIVKFSPTDPAKDKREPPAAIRRAEGEASLADSPVLDKAFLAELPRDLLELAYACALFGLYFPVYLIPQLFAEEGKNPVMVSRGLRMLSSLRVIYDPEDPSIRLAGFIPTTAEVLGKRAETIKKVVWNRLLAWVHSSRLKPCFNFLEILAELGGEGSEELMLDAVCGDIINGTFSDIEKAVNDGTFAKVVGKKRTHSLLSIFRTQKALNHGSAEEIRKAFKDPLPAETSPGFKVRMYANRACFCLSLCDIESAAALVKEAMLITQNENSGRDLDHIYFLFSLVEFSNQKLSDALDYFGFAVENAKKSGNHSELAIIAYYAASAHFIFGNISKAERLVFQAESSALAAGRPGWADRSRFLRGRFRFELGQYQDALNIFKDLETNFAGPESEGFKQTLAAWIFRTNVYLHNRVGHLGGIDAELFEIEAAFFSGEYRKTLELADALKNGLSQRTSVKGERFLYVEQPDWRSGFAQCELSLFFMRDFWDRMILTYRALALCHISGAETRPPAETHENEAARDMQRIMRDELPDTDPNDAFYLYSYYRILKRSGAPEVDMNTAISLAFKRLQRRASRIDDNETRRSFLSLQYWNGSLAVAAKEHKLI
jgi:tetratricopeptide (TPR) repeat protein